MGDFLIGEVVSGLLTVVAATLELLWGLLAGTAFTTPDVSGLPQVTAVSGRLMVIVNVSFGLVIVATGFVVMGRETVQSRYGLAELGPRLVIGWVAANFATPLCGWLIGFANSFTEAVTGAGIRPQEDLRQLTAVLVSSMSNVTDAFLAVVIAVVLTVLTGMLLVGWIVRTGALIVVVCVAPIALACHASPFTDGAARLWWRSLTVLLATVTLQALALHVTLTVFLDPHANLPGMFLPKDPTGDGTVNLLVIACLLFAMLRIPGLLRRNLGGGGRQQNVLGVVLRMAVMQRVTGLLRLPLQTLGVGRAARRTASAAAGGAGRGRGVASAVLSYWRPRMPSPLPVSRLGLNRSAASAALAGQSDPPRGGPGVADRPVAAMVRPRRPVAPGVNPATAMPRQRPAWQTRTASRVAPAVPPGVTPATVMPRQRPTWQVRNMPGRAPRRTR
ncbi:conjugal transfer protein TrbL family protein [Dactylosporangium sp. NPDC005555]|uniref:conjugal transfer protein TrbL family protein n=1 Tax=Dactylosporangium sp. NPDC005555 TaxID=3154889 RepID=UPI0033A549C3